MALDITTLQTTLETAFKANITHITQPQDTQINILCGQIATAIDDYIKSATITYTTGLITTSGPVTGVLGAIIS